MTERKAPEPEEIRAICKEKGIEPYLDIKCMGFEVVTETREAAESCVRRLIQNIHLLNGAIKVEQELSNEIVELVKKKRSDYAKNATEGSDQPAS